MDSDPLRELNKLLQASGTSDTRKRRLVACGLVRRVSRFATDTTLRDALLACVAAGEGWAEEDFEDEAGGERAQLLRAYDRRHEPSQLAGIVKTVQLLCQPAMFMETERDIRHWLWRVAQTPLADFARLRDCDLIDLSQQARQCTACHAHATYDPEWLDWRVARQTDELEGRHQLLIARDILGDPLALQPVDPPWLSDTAILIARGMYESQDFSAMPILADALQDAGCDNDAILTHCRDPQQAHVRGCWVVDLVLGKS